MKRRHFLAASALLSLLAPSSVLAANKKKTASKPARRSSTKKASRPSAKPAAAAEAATAASPAEAAAHDATSLPDEPATPWRTYDITSTIALNKVSGKLRLWLPLALHTDSLWQRSLGHSWQGNFTSAGIYRDPAESMVVFYADWNDGAAAPQLQITSQVNKRDRHFDITRRGNAAERGEVLRHYLHSSNLIPTDGLVRRTAERAIGRIKDPLAQGKAIYDWVIENTSYDPAPTGIGRGDIEAMLDSGQLSGKSIDISLLFVGLCRSIGIPARPFFGMRIDSSRLFAGLGATGELSARQHCRAEFYTPGYGWIPVDPADVRRAIHEEHLSDSDPKLVVLSKLLFGFWEMNWVAFNSTLDVKLRGGNGRTLPFLAVPQAEAAAGRNFDSSDASLFSYTVNASRVDS